MKNCLALTAVTMMMAVNMNAEEVTIKENVSDGGVLLISEIEAAGGINDDVVTFYVSNNSGSYKNGWGIGGFGKSSRWDTTVEFTGKEGMLWTYEYTVTKIKEIADGDEGIRLRLWHDCMIDKITIQPSITYGEAKQLAFDENGFITANQFEGLSDYAKIVFTYSITGDISGFTNWGVGRVGSNNDTGSGPTVSIGSLAVTGIGEQTFTCRFPDIKKALEATPDGIIFQVWGLGDGTCTVNRVKVEAFDISSGSTGVMSIGMPNKNGNTCYSITGRRIGAHMRGIIIKNGKKYFIK